MTLSLNSALLLLMLLHQRHGFHLRSHTLLITSVPVTTSADTEATKHYFQIRNHVRAKICMKNYISCMKLYKINRLPNIALFVALLQTRTDSSPGLSLPRKSLDLVLNRGLGRILVYAIFSHYFYLPTLGIFSCLYGDSADQIEQIFANIEMWTTLTS